MLSFQRILAGTAAAAVIALVACASSLQSIAPFPCAEDGTCPDGFGCGQDDSKCYACLNGVTSGQACSGTCTDLTTSSDCGSCGNACTGQTTCLFGSCGCATGTACGGSCADLTSDADNCGACGTTCKGAETCISSKCACPPGDVVCGSDTCSDLQTDGSNCGMCGMACPATQVCAAGQCGCPPQTQICPSESPTACVNFTTDSNNCDGCGNVCPTGMTCMESACKCAPPPGGGACDVFPACGCPANTQCARDNGAPEVCVAVGGTPTGQNCTTSSECGPGDVCGSNGICATLCSTTTPCAEPNYVCTPDVYDDVMQGFSICVAHCDPLSPFTTTAVDAPCNGLQTCVPTSGVSGGSFCGSVTTSGGSGAPCTSYTDCEAELTCVTFNGSMSTGGSCESLCTVGAPCPNGGACLPFDPTLTVDGEMLGFCGAPCNLEYPSESCASGDTCVYSYANSGANVGTVCEAITSEGTAGTTCVSADECAAGQQCAYANTTATSGTCTAWCTNFQGACPGGGTCNAFNPIFTVNNVEYGLCEVAQ